MNKGQNELATDAYRTIRTLLYAALASALLITALAGGVVSWSQTQSAALSVSTLDFHLASLLSIANARTQLRDIDDFPRTLELTGGEISKLRSARYLLRKEVDTLHSLQRSYGDGHSFEQTVARLDAHYNRLELWLEETRTTNQELQSKPHHLMVALHLSLVQLERLHARALEDDEEDRAATSAWAFTVLSGSFAAGIILAGALSLFFARRVITGLTDLEGLEGELRQLNAELEARVSERTADLEHAQEELVRTERLAMLGEIAGGIGHEIRNPLGAISNSLYFLRITDAVQSDKGKNHLVLMEESVGETNRVVSELLDFARDPESSYVPFSPTEVIQRAIDASKIPDDVRLALQLDTNSREVMGDPNQIERVLSNLIRNAVQAMPSGGLLEVRDSHDGAEVVIEVADSGIGMGSDQLAKAFLPLYTNKSKGIGLGLALCRRYVEAHGGRIDCTSTLGSGASFRVHLPIIQRKDELA